MKIYISGPITGTDDYRERFNAAEKKLTDEGHVVYNPVKLIDALPECTTYDEYMKMDFYMIDMADAIYLMSGWRKSLGATTEYIYAVQNGKGILRERRELDVARSIIDDIAYIGEKLNEDLESVIDTKSKSECFEKYKALIINIVKSYILDENDYKTKEKDTEWHPAYMPPDSSRVVFLKFENSTVVLKGRYIEDKDGGAYYILGASNSCVQMDLYVAEWKEV